MMNPLGSFNCLHSDLLVVLLELHDFPLQFCPVLLVPHFQPTILVRTPSPGRPSTATDQSPAARASSPAAVCDRGRRGRFSVVQEWRLGQQRTSFWSRAHDFAIGSPAGAAAPAVGHHLSSYYS
jgi:hypothetical protein